VTAARRFESVHRFKTLPLYVQSAAGFRMREVVFAGTSVESFSLRETRHAVSLRVFAAFTVLETSAV
jgi:hypothetical protein